MSQNIVQESLEAPLGATAERQAVVSAAGDTPGKDWVIVTRGIKREYDMGGEIVRALRRDHGLPLGGGAERGF